MTKNGEKLPARSTPSEVDAFLAKVAATPPPSQARAPNAGGSYSRLDATASREPTWDQACHIQSEMFGETAGLGGLDIQLCYYRGFREFAGDRVATRCERSYNKDGGGPLRGRHDPDWPGAQARGCRGGKQKGQRC